MINTRDDRSADDRKINEIPPGNPSHTLNRQPSNHEDPIHSMKGYLPEETLRYMQKRRAQKETSFMGYI